MSRSAKKPGQLGLFSVPRGRSHGAARRGRKPREDRVGLVPHMKRPEHDERHPVHVTMRRVLKGPSFRRQSVCVAIVHEIAAAKARGVRVVQYSVQDDHLHLMVEGTDRGDLSNQMRKLFSRIAFAVNALARRHGSLFRGRHHRHALKTPTEVRNALVYILFNVRKHGPAYAAQRGLPEPKAHEMRGWLDPMSSAPWFKDWDPAKRPPATLVDQCRATFADAGSTASTSRAETWLARRGWLRAGGPLRFDEMPRNGR